MEAINELYPAWVVMVFYGMLGLVAGSFVNVLIARVPQRETILTRSHCVKCDKQIQWYDNVPLLSWLILRGKCRYCGEKISVKYPLVELLTGAAWVVITYFNGSVFIPEPLVLGLYLLASISVALAVIDFETLTLPNPLVLWFTIIATVSVLTNGVYHFISTHSLNTSTFETFQPLIVAAASAAVFGVLYFVLWFSSGGRWVGYGDVKLVPALGLVSGYISVETAVLAFLLPYLFSGIPILVMMLTGHVKRGKQIPFGPFLLIGFWCSLLFSDWIFQTYLKVSGLQ